MRPGKMYTSPSALNMLRVIEPVQVNGLLLVLFHAFLHLFPLSDKLQNLNTFSNITKIQSVVELAHDIILDLSNFEHFG